MKNFFLIFVFILFTLLLTKNYFHLGFPYTHDGENHLARFANYKIAVKEKQFPPRFAPNLLNHYGYPVFNYNYPLGNILSLPFSFLKINYEVTFKIIAIASVFFGALGAYSYILSLDFSRRSAIFTTFFWLGSPYLISLINFRGNIGEILAFSLLPWMLWTIEKAKIKQYFSSYYFFFSVAISTMFLLSHNISAVFAIPLLFVIVIVRFGKNYQFYKNWLCTFAISIAASLWFWLPALAEMNQIVIGESNANQDFFTHFPTFQQLLFSPIQFGFSKVGTIDSLSFQVGMIVIAAVVYFLVRLLTEFIKKKKLTAPKIIYTSFLLVIALIFFQLQSSQAIWHIFPQLKFIQFPWRLTLFISALVLPLVAYFVDSFFIHHKKLLACCVILQVLFILPIKPVDYFHRTNVDYDAYTGSTSTQNENTPKTFNFSEVGEWKPGPQLSSDFGKIVDISTWTGSQHRYTVSIQTETVVRESTANFLGWKSWFRKLSEKNWQELPYSTSPATHGLISYELKPGEYEIISSFTQKTPARVVGNTVSFVTILGVVFYFLYQKNTQRL